MKTIRVLLLLVSVQVFTPVSSDKSPESAPAATSGNSTAAQAAATGNSTAVPAVPTGNSNATAPAAATGNSTAAPAAATGNSTAAPAAATGNSNATAPAVPTGNSNATAPAVPTGNSNATAPAVPTGNSTAAPTAAHATVPHGAASKTPEKAPGKTEPTASATEKTESGTTLPQIVAPKHDETSKNGTLQPRAHRPPKSGNESMTENETNKTQGPDDSTEKTNTGKGIPTPAPGPLPGIPKQPNKQDKNKGTQTGTEVKEAKSDKKLWWIALPVLLVGAAAAIVLKFKCKKVHDHSETIDTGTENASFQSRPESTKDGVMLLGVKSSGGEENAAAR